MNNTDSYKEGFIIGSSGNNYYIPYPVNTEELSQWNLGFNKGRQLRNSMKLKIEDELFEDWYNQYNTDKEGFKNIYQTLKKLFEK